MDEGVRIFPYQYLKYLTGSLTCRKILRLGTPGFASHPKEGVLRNFIALKNSSPWPGFNPRPLGPVASTLATTLLRQLNIPIQLVKNQNNMHIYIYQILYILHVNMTV
jgi:hypothetical protein